MEDHYHYAQDIHGAAEEHHRHYDLENELEREKESRIRDVSDLWDEIRELRKIVSSLGADI